MKAGGLLVAGEGGRHRVPVARQPPGAASTPV